MVIINWAVDKLSLSLFIYLKKYRDETETHPIINWVSSLMGKTIIDGVSNVFGVIKSIENDQLMRIVWLLIRWTDCYYSISKCLLDYYILAYLRVIIKLEFIL